MRNSTRGEHIRVLVMLGVAGTLAFTGLVLEPTAQQGTRLSALIEQLENGEPAISDVH